MRNAGIAILALFAVTAWGQDVSRVYHFANIKTPAGYQEVMNIFRSAAEVRDVSVNAANASLAADGTADQMALTDWLFPEVDQPAAGPAPANHTYTMGSGGVVRVLHFAHAGTPAQMQEIVNVVRTAADVNRVFPVRSAGLIVVRGTADQVALTDWLVQQLDVVGPTPGAPTQARQFPGVTDSEVRVVHPAHTITPVGLQELTNSLRTIADMNRVFPVNAPGVLLFRGNADSVALAEWLVNQLDLPAGQQGPAPHEQQLNTRFDKVARVFYLTHAGSAQALQQIVTSVRTEAKVARIYPCSQPQALAVRGTADQISAAADLIAQMDR